MSSALGRHFRTASSRDWSSVTGLSLSKYK